MSSGSLEAPSEAMLVEEPSSKRVCRRDESSAAVVLGVNTNATNTGNRKVGHAFRTPSLQASGNLFQMTHADPFYHTIPATSCSPATNAELKLSAVPTESTTYNNAYTDMDEIYAKRQIQLICRTPACWRGESDERLMVELLQRFPVLASQNFDWDYNLFWKHGNEWSSPLSFLLVAGAKLEVIEAVYKLYPAALWQPSGIGRELPLHFACRFGVSDDVLMFLMAKFPVAVTVSNLLGMLPIHCAIGKKEIFPYGKFQHARMETLRLLVEMYPQSLLKEENEKHFTPLQLAFSHGYSFQVIDYMIGKLPESVGKFTLVAGCYHKLFGVKIDLSEAELISKLLPKLSSFKCQPTRWETCGLVKMMEDLQQNQSIVEFQACNLSGDILQGSAVSSALENLLEQNAILEALSLEVRNGIQNEIDTDSFIRSLPRAFRNSQRLKKLELSNFSATVGALIGFLTSEYTPESVHLNNLILIREDKEGACNSHQSPHRNSKLRKLVISGCRYASQQEGGSILPVSQPTLLPLLNCVARLPQVVELALRLPHFKELDITDPLVHLLKSGSLKTLAVRGPLVQIQPFCDTLRNNTTLCKLDYPKCFIPRLNRGLLANALEIHNATLKAVRISNPSNLLKEKEYQKIKYCTQLNQRGRAIMRHPNAVVAVVVKLLQPLDGLTATSQPHETLGIYYGLLRESPGLWAQR